MLIDLRLKVLKHLALGISYLLEVLLLGRVDWSLKGVDKDEHLDEEGLSEEVVLELQVQKGVPSEIFRILRQDLSVLFIYMKKWL